MITLREFSEKNDIKKPTVNARLKRIERDNPDKKLTVKKENVIYLTDFGLALLEKNFKDTPVKAPAKGKTSKKGNKTPLKGNNSDLIKLYQEKIKWLEKENKRLTLQNEKLIDTLSGAFINSQKLISDSQQLISDGQKLLNDNQKLVNNEQSLILLDKTDNKSSSDKSSKRIGLLSRVAVAGRVLFKGL